MAAAAAVEAAPAVALPWWQKVRWRQTSRAEGRAAEQHLLALTGTQLGAQDVAIGPDKEEFMHTITGGQQNADSPPLVSVPGYGAGSSFQFRILHGLSAGFRMFAVDLLGTGLSGRPPFKACSTEEAEDFFISSLAKWRVAQGLQDEKMVLMGHSLGGYLSAYALRHPEHVQHLILVCPAGIGKQPEDWELPERLRSPWSLRGQLFRLATSLWDWGFTPGSFIRGVGPLGPRIVAGYTRKRFHQGHHLTDKEAARFEKYMYSILALPGSGEYALRHLLAPFAWPRQPLEDRLHELKVPVTFIYGEQDWMDPRAAKRVTDSLAAVRKPLLPGDQKILITKNAGHYNFVDQPGIFLRQVAEACEGLLPAAASARLLAASEQQPYYSDPTPDATEELRGEMARNPVEAEAHVATDL